MAFHLLKVFMFVPVVRRGEIKIDLLSEHVYTEAAG
jgi:hypothetical protein